MNRASSVIFTLTSLFSSVRTPDSFQGRFEIFVLNAKEFVFRNEGEVFHTLTIIIFVLDLGIHFKST